MANLYLVGHGITSVATRKTEKEAILSFGKLTEKRELGENLLTSKTPVQATDVTHIVFTNIEAVEVVKKALNEIERILTEQKSINK